MKKLLSLFIISQIVLSNLFPTFEGIVLESDTRRFSFDLFCNEKQSVVFTDSSGTEWFLSVEYLPESNADTIPSRISNGSHKVSASCSTLSLSFYILVNSNYIVQAYDGSYSTSVYTVISSSLEKLSSVSAKYSVTCRGLLFNVTKWVKGTIQSDGTLEVSANL